MMSATLRRSPPRLSSLSRLSQAKENFQKAAKSAERARAAAASGDPKAAKNADKEARAAEKADAEFNDAVRALAEMQDRFYSNDMPAILRQLEASMEWSVHLCVVLCANRLQ